VLHRGTKREIARHFEQLAPLTDAQKTAGVERYIEFTPTAVGHKRWRIVVIGPVWTDADVAKTPSEEPGAGWLRNSMRYAA
jgi:hypothetical protein